MVYFINTKFQSVYFLLEINIIPTSFEDVPLGLQPCEPFALLSQFSLIYDEPCARRSSSFHALRAPHNLSPSSNLSIYSSRSELDFPPKKQSTIFYSLLLPAHAMLLLVHSIFHEMQQIFFSATYSSFNDQKKQMAEWGNLSGLLIKQEYLATYKAKVD